MRIGFLITARLKSVRLKLKLLKQLNGYSVIDRVIYRAKQVENCDDIILCTSKKAQDLPLVRKALNNQIYYFNGDSDDVLYRLTNASKLFNLDFAICMTADNPLFSIYYTNLIVDKIRQNPEIDFIYTDDLPIGVNVYAVNVKALQTICLIKEETDTERWGHLIDRPEIFNVVKQDVCNADKINIDRITLDESEDFEFMHQIFGKFPKDYLIEEMDIKNILDNYPKLCDVNSHVIQRKLDSETKNRIDDFFSKNKKLILNVKNKVYKK